MPVRLCVCFRALERTYLGYIAPWSGRFYSLWDTGYAKIHIPIIASVSEHQPTTWVSFFFDLHITAAVFPAGLWFCVKNVNDERVFGRKLYPRRSPTSAFSYSVRCYGSLFRRCDGTPDADIDTGCLRSGRHRILAYLRKVHAR